MKFSHALLLASSLAFLACGEEDSPSSAPNNKFDCSVTGGVKVVYPTKGESFKIGQKITVIFGSDVDDSGYMIKFKTGKEDQGVDLTEESVGPAGQADGKTCYEAEVTLDASKVKETTTGYIRVVPYIKTNKGANSAEFTVKK